MIKKILFWFLVLFIIFVAIFPFYYAFITSFKTGTDLFVPDILPKNINFDNFISVLSTGSFVLNIFNSLIISSLVVSISLVLSLGASYALSRIKFKGRNVILLCILSVSMFPQVAILAGLFELITKANLYNSMLSLIFSYMIFTLPFTVWILTTFMRDLPVEMEEAAIIDGAKPSQIIIKIFLPLMWPALVTTGLLAFIASWNEFLFALTFISDDTRRTIPVAIAMLSGASEQEIPWGNIMAACVIVTIPLIILVLIFQKKIISGLTAGSVKG